MPWRTTSRRARCIRSLLRERRVLHLGADAGLQMFELVHDRAHRRAPVQGFAFAGAHGHMPIRINVRSGHHPDKDVALSTSGIRL